MDETLPLLRTTPVEESDSTMADDTQNKYIKAIANLNDREEVVRQTQRAVEDRVALSNKALQEVMQLQISMLQHVQEHCEARKKIQAVLETCSDIGALSESTTIVQSEGTDDPTVQ